MGNLKSLDAKNKTTTRVTKQREEEKNISVLSDKFIKLYQYRVADIFCLKTLTIFKAIDMEFFTTACGVAELVQHDCKSFPRLSNPISEAVTTYFQKSL